MMGGSAAIVTTRNFFGRVDVWGLTSMNLGVRMAWTIKDELFPSLEMSI
jgi:hypothetical protein